LISKILLGTLACLPAYDDYFLIGLKSVGISDLKIGENSLIEIFKLCNKIGAETFNENNLTNKGKGTFYPMMKLIDMYLWQLGYDISLGKE
jgi:hypothetical protein